ncbi:MAG TPA: bacteriochlorophyll 4-vinyl reductase [Chlorobaculum sp.]|jgi:divinyl protochlorophyllide a 8-vinyl-reductase|uniref:Bacteriochlorophyll synthase, 23 kDa subunit n=2 Tax=Chlorobaculum tepidum TaxID=1097 RepID=H2VFJ8_CHLTE|nr:bacteriochlorophyll 4-vinyl reductase [Chlorobaculum tepidum]AAG15194.1 BchJ [Chlorobaculum tepidum]AAM73232.1 bacteriochlorophyll synthase, 23 kDa subunit [Chlorobaculum tepidum TLS]HBU23346.1 bacteriochlorophyll 4-vinyl reductase [Chlorobaculum sp.]
MSSSPSRIGPNSIIQTVGALETAYGKNETEKLLKKIGQGYLINNLPSEMVEESKFHALVTALQKELGETATAGILKESGERTAKYLLKVRIPGPFQTIVKLLPAGLAFKVLLFAISKNAWTFAGSGEFSYGSKPSPNVMVKVTFPSHPVVSNFYLGTFTALLRELVSPKTEIKADIRKEGSAIRCNYLCKI